MHGLVYSDGRRLSEFGGGRRVSASRISSGTSFVGECWGFGNVLRGCEGIERLYRDLRKFVNDWGSVHVDRRVRRKRLN